jgi:precorrin-6x reductase
LGIFLNSTGTTERAWFISVAPEPGLLEGIVQRGIPRENVCCMVGMFSREANRALFQKWRID